jgi:uncharacterized lipoprotein YajG
VGRVYTFSMSTLAATTFFTTAQTIAEMFDVSQRMHAVAQQLSNDASVSAEVTEWQSRADSDMAAFNALHNL